MNKSFVFWIHDWNRKFLSFPDPSRLAKLTIDGENIVLETFVSPSAIQFPERLPIKSISRCEDWSGTPSTARTVKITTVGNDHYEIVPANPFDPTLLKSTNAAETWALIIVVNAVIQKSPLEIDVNPYIRQLNKKEGISQYINSVDERWDADVSPYHYYTKYSAEKEKNRVRNQKLYNAFILLLFLALVIISIGVIVFGWFS